MCKVFIAPGINDDNRKHALELIYEMAIQMSSGNDKDGLGYAAMTKHGDLFGERWLFNSDAFVERDNGMTDLEQSLVDDSLKQLQTYGEFGIGRRGLKSIAAITLHTRFATSGKGFNNCHPFVTPDLKTSLIHNGVIHNQRKLKNVYSTNDSECILHEYLDADVSNNPANIQLVADRLDGWYACGVFGQTNDGQKFLDVFKESSSSLYGVYIKELESVVYSTSLEYIQTACRNVGLTISRSYIVNPGILIRLSPYSGRPILKQPFTFETGKKIYTGGSFVTSDDDYEWNRYWQKNQDNSVRSIVKMTHHRNKQSQRKK